MVSLAASSTDASLDDIARPAGLCQPAGDGAQLTEGVLGSVYRVQVRIGLRFLKAETTRWLGESLQRGRLSHDGLEWGLCEWDDWRNAAGKLCVASAAKALPRGVSSCAGASTRAPGVVFAHAVDDMRPLILREVLEWPRPHESSSATQADVPRK